MAVDSDSLWLSVITAVVFLTYLDHLWHSIQRWRIDRSAAAFRGLFIAIMLQVGLFRVLVGIVQRAFPDVLWIEVVRITTAPILTVMLLSGGLVLSWSWRTKREWRKP